MPSETTDDPIVVCTTCGANYRGTARFCGVDGTVLKPLQQQKQPSPPGAVANTRICPRCKQLFPSYAQFCPADSSRLETIVAGGTTDISTSDSVPLVTASARSNSVVFEREEETIIGKTFAGKYRIDSMLGEGGMARVYLATHLQIEKVVVIKLMNDNHSSRERDTAIKRFEQEIKITAKLSHPNVISVFDGGVLHHRPYLVMEYIQGESLRDLINNRGPLNFRDTINIVSQICAGLYEAHQQGVVHRDLKPENIMLRDQPDRPDWVKVVDFGIAHLKQGGTKLTATGMAVGTVDYMSPEYLSDKPIDHRADVYALGIILFELLTGTCPFESETCEAVLTKHLFTTPMPPSRYRKDMTPGCKLDAIIERALEKNPDNRYQTTMEMRRALQEAMSNPAGA